MYFAQAIHKMDRRLRAWGLLMTVAGVVLAILPLDSSGLRDFGVFVFIAGVITSVIGFGEMLIPNNWRGHQVS